MEATLLSVPMVQNHSSFREEAEYVPFEEVREEDRVSIKSNVSFLEANTSEISIEELTTQCVVPTWANQELTISHQDFIHTVHEAALPCFQVKPFVSLQYVCRTLSVVVFHQHLARKQVSC